MTVVAASVILAIGLVLAAVLVAVANRPRMLERRAHRTVVVTLKSGATFRGVIVESDADVLALKSVQAVADTPVPVDGELIVMRTDVDYIQLP